MAWTLALTTVFFAHADDLHGDEHVLDKSAGKNNALVCCVLVCKMCVLGVGHEAKLFDLHHLWHGFLVKQIVLHRSSNVSIEDLRQMSRSKSKYIWVCPYFVLIVHEESTAMVVLLQKLHLTLALGVCDNLQRMSGQTT